MIFNISFYSRIPCPLSPLAHCSPSYRWSGYPLVVLSKHQNINDLIKVHRVGRIHRDGCMQIMRSVKHPSLSKTENTYFFSWHLQTIEMSQSNCNKRGLFLMSQSSLGGYIRHSQEVLVTLLHEFYSFFSLLRCKCSVNDEHGIS